MNAIPGVQLAAITSALPAAGQPFSTPLVIEDRPAESSEDLTAEGIRVSPDYFRVIQAPLVRGRFFTQSDEDGKLPVAIIDEATALHWAIEFLRSRC